MYRIIDDQTVQRIEDGACIPRDPANRDYAKFLEWESKGGTAEPPAPAGEPLDPPRQTERTEAKAILKDTEATTDEKLDAVIKLLGLDE